MSSGQARRWILTLNNYTEEECKTIWDVLHHDFEEGKFGFCVIGKEVAPSTGTPHLQRFIGGLKNAKTIGGMKKWLGTKRVSLRIAYGSEGQNETYCGKDDVWLKLGEAKQGARNDLISMRDAIKEGKKLTDMIDDEVITSGSALKSAAALIPLFEKPRTWKTEVIWIHGPSGCGKSRMAAELAGIETAYYKSGSTGHWWDGYDGHETVVWDEFRDSQCPLADFLQLCDRYPFTVQTKGGSRKFLAKKIYFTSVFTPENLYKNAKNEPKEQILRRIDRTIDATRVEEDLVPTWQVRAMVSFLNQLDS